MNRIRTVLALALLGVLAALVVAPPTSARPAQTKTRITVTMTEYRIVLSKKVVPNGELVFTIFNRGKLVHTFKIGTKVTLGIGPGKTGRLVIVLPKGLYRYTSTLDADAKKGMRGVLRLT
jgi:hypothetical protein